MKDQLALESPPARRHGTDQPRHHTKPTTQQHNSTSNRAHTNYHEKSGLEAHVVAYPDVIAVAATLLTARPRVEQPRTPTEPAWPTLLLDRINERTGAHHADATPVEQWAQYRRLFATAVLTTRSDGAELACRA